MTDLAVAAQSAWVEDFLAYCSANDVPFDFVSTHE
jgi:beta-xylosidase